MSRHCIPVLAGNSIHDAEKAWNSTRIQRAESPEMGRETASSWTGMIAERIWGDWVSGCLEVGGEGGERTREAEARKATPLRRVANCMFAVAPDCSKENQMIDVKHNLCKALFGKQEVVSLWFVCD
jgi:hypothetical protein